MKYCCYELKGFVNEGSILKEIHSKKDVRYFVSLENFLNKGIHCHVRIFHCLFCGKRLKDK